MTLDDVFATLRDITTDRSAAGVAGTSAVSAVTYDSRRVMAGAVFVALRGLKADGATFAAQAATRGAILIAAETPRPDELQTPWLVVSDARLALALLADAFYDHPSRRI